MKKTLKKYRHLFIITIILSALEAFVLSFFSLKLGKIIDVISNNGEEFLESMIWCISLSVGFAIIGLIKCVVESKYSTKVNHDLKVRLYEKIQERTIYEYSKNTNEYYLNILTKNIDTIQSDYVSKRVDLVSQILMLLSSMGMLFYINWILAFCFYGITMGVMGLAQIPGIFMAKRQDALNKNNKQFLDVTNNHLKGYNQIKLLSLYDVFKIRFESADKKLENSRKSFNFTSSAMMIYSLFLMVISQLGSLSIAVSFSLKGIISVGLIVSSINLLNNVFGPLQYISNDINYIKSTTPIITKINKILEYKREEKEEIKDKIERIEFKNVSIKFKDKVVHKDFNKTFEANKKYAVIGESGVGKSSLFKCLLNYYDKDTYEGLIKINEQDLKSIDDLSIYERIGFIERNNFIESGTVMDNILLGRDETVDKNLLDKFKFDEEFINKQVDKGSSEIISSGEKQRIDILRFMIKDYNVLIFGEPTSNLDKETTKLIFDQILNIKDKIVICITHNTDKEILEKFDEIIEIK